MICRMTKAMRRPDRAIISPPATTASSTAPTCQTGELVLDGDMERLLMKHLLKSKLKTKLRMMRLSPGLLAISCKA